MTSLEAALRQIHVDLTETRVSFALVGGLAVIENAAHLWTHLGLEEKQRLQQVLFPEGLSGSWTETADRNLEWRPQREVIAFPGTNCAGRGALRELAAESKPIRKPVCVFAQPAGSPQRAGPIGSSPAVVTAARPSAPASVRRKARAPSEFSAVAIMAAE